MIDLDQIAADDVHRYEGHEPPLSSIEACASRRRRRRRVVATGATGAVLALVAVIGTMLAGGPNQQEIDTAPAKPATTTQPRPTIAGPAPSELRTFASAEGLWLDELLPLIAAQLPNITKSDLQAALESNQIRPAYRPDGIDSWEGLLLPGVYETDDDDSAIDVLRAMNDEFTAVADELGYQSAETRLQMSAYEVIIVASIVEAEANNDQDRGRIARVIYNRLEARLSLSIDATCIYGTGNRNFEFTAEILSDFGAFYDPGYACRNNPGLPPTPIAAPGRASLQAAIDPAPIPINDHGEEVRWLYYVAKDAQGNHLFTDDFDEFTEQRRLSTEQGLLS